MPQPLDWSPADGANPWAAAVLLHPHPDMGGNRFNIVVDALYRRLPPAGVAAARFDFSSSKPAVAAAEVADALDDVGGRFHGPLLLIGYSFGADIATTIGEGDDRLAGWFLIAPPLRIVAPETMVVATDPRPKGLAVGDDDQFCPPARAAEVTKEWPNTTLTTVAGADHFFATATATVADQALAWAERAIGR